MPNGTYGGVRGGLNFTYSIGMMASGGSGGRVIHGYAVMRCTPSA